MNKSLILTKEQVEYIIRLFYFNYALLPEDITEYYSTEFKKDAEIRSLLMESGQLTGSEFRDLYSKFRDEKFSYNKRITEELFCGAGNSTSLWISNLHKRIDYGISHLSGTQQNGGMGHEFDEERDKQDKQEIKNVLLDVITAFGMKPEDLV
jgi:hypothetical protein